MSRFLRLLVIAIFCLAPHAATADTWRGTAPFCNGKCKQGESVVQRSKTGNGGRCVSGTKVLCRNSAALCTPRQTRTSCAGVVMICDGGYYTLPNVWKSCGKYACGACAGF